MQETRWVIGPRRDPEIPTSSKIFCDAAKGGMLSRISQRWRGNLDHRLTPRRMSVKFVKKLAECPVECIAGVNASGDFGQGTGALHFCDLVDGVGVRSTAHLQTK